MKKPVENQEPVQKEIPFDDQPVGRGNHQQIMDPQEVQINNEIKAEDNFVVDYNTQPSAQELNEAPQIEENEAINTANPEVNAPPIDPNILNVDEIQIQPKKQLTFEEMLEKELNEKENSSNALPPDDDRVIRKPKREFLKRTSKKSKVPKQKNSKNKYKYYADNFQEKEAKKNTANSGSDVDKSDRSKSTSKSRAKLDNDNKSDENHKIEEPVHKPFLSKGAGVGGGKKKQQEIEAEEVVQTPKFPIESVEETSKPDETGGSSKNRRSRKARGPNLPPTENFDTKVNRQNSLEEFEQIENNLTEEKRDDYQVLTKSNGHSSTQKSK